MIRQIADRIQKQINKEKESVKKVEDEEEDVPILGQDPATWSPVDSSGNKNNPGTQGDNYPGKGGSGTYQGNVVPI
jgi:hypothetical protein